jgi:lipopolysaccharide/colanic/teichoic acid biosynthesis glycosyltransferase
MATTCKKGIKANALSVPVNRRNLMYRKFFKPLIDWLTSLCLFILISPCFIIFAIITWFSTSGDVFFIHQRPGLNGKPFKLLKFKTMNDKCGIDGELLPNVQRITRFGCFMRKMSIDEIPQLINVLKGDLSLVGPRPLEIRYLNLYTEEQKRRHNVKPGMTGWAQIKGRNTLTWEEKFKLDIWYVDNLNFSLDMKILLTTLVKVLKREGINSDASNTVVPFDIYLKSKNNRSI